MTLCYPLSAIADPLDAGEAYTTRQGAPEWMDGIDFGLLLLDYSIFALVLIALGWLLFKKPQYLQRLESLIRRPFQAVFSAATRVGGVTEFVLQLFGGLAVFVTLAGWFFFCQWLKSQGLGALSMAGLAFAALMLVRAIKGDEKG
ncbi:MAG: hypothetical protein Q9M25_08170 [Mariprofundaceae bacterium]|nr:hypothetical protein [Mariprofundaceae bacterium]